ELAADLRQPMDVPKDALAERHAVLVPVFRQKLALEPGDIHADRTFGLARPALQAQVEYFEDPVITEAGLRQPAGHRQPQRFGAAARRAPFAPRGHVRGTHRAFELLAAGADAAAHFHGPSKAAIFRIVEPGRRIGRAVTRAVPEVLRQRRTVDD